MFRPRPEYPHHRPGGVLPAAPSPGMGNMGSSPYGPPFFSNLAGGHTGFPPHLMHLPSGQAALQPPRPPMLPPQPSMQAPQFQMQPVQPFQPHMQLFQPAPQFQMQPSQPPMQPPQHGHFIPPLPGSPPSEIPPPPPSGPPPSPPPPPPLPVERSVSDPSISLPPSVPIDPEMVTNIEVLAAFVVKNGLHFELMARAKQAGDPKFAFLFESDPGTEAAIGHEYYEWKKRSLESEINHEADSMINKDLERSKVRECSQEANNIPVLIARKEVRVSPTVSDMDMEDDPKLASPEKDKSRHVADPKTYFVLGSGKVSEKSSHELVNPESSDSGSPIAIISPAEQDADVAQDTGNDSADVHLNIQDSGVKMGFVMEDLSPERSPSSDKSELEAFRAGSEASIEHCTANGMGERFSRSSRWGFKQSIKQDGEPSDNVYSDRERPAQTSKEGQAVVDEREYRDDRFSHTSNSYMDGDHPASINTSDETEFVDHIRSRIDAQDQKTVAADDSRREEREGSQMSDSDGQRAPKKRSYFRSRSRSPGDSKSRRRSISSSPVTRSRSRSGSPKLRSRSRTPLMDSKWGGGDHDFLESERREERCAGQHICFDYAKGKCFRGTSCEFLHEENTIVGGRWTPSNLGGGRRESSSDYQIIMETRAGLSSPTLMAGETPSKKGLEIASKLEDDSHLRQKPSPEEEKHDVDLQTGNDENDMPSSTEKMASQEPVVSDEADMAIKPSASAQSLLPEKARSTVCQPSSIHESQSTGQHPSSLPSKTHAPSLSSSPHPVSMGHYVPSGNSMHHQPPPLDQPFPSRDSTLNAQETLRMRQRELSGNSSLQQPKSVYRPLPQEFLAPFQQQGQRPAGQPAYHTPLPSQTGIPQGPAAIQQSYFSSTNQPSSFLGNPPVLQQLGFNPTLTSASKPVQHGFSSMPAVSMKPTLPHPFIGDTSKHFTFPNLVKTGGQGGVLTAAAATVSTPMPPSSLSMGMPWMAHGSLGSHNQAAQSSRSAHSSILTYTLPGMTAVSGFLPIHRKPVSSDSTSGKPYDPLADSIEPETSFVWKRSLVNYDLQAEILAANQLVEDIRRGDTVLNIPALENTTPAHVTEKIEAMNLKPPAGMVTENPGTRTAGDENAIRGFDVVGSLSPPDGNRNWSPGQPVEGEAGIGEVEAGQEQAQLKVKKSEGRGLKMLRAAVAEYVKEVLKPAWREGHMSKEAFKTIAKKAVDKVTGTLHSHQIPKSQEKVDQYMASSRTKISKLVQGYVDKHSKT